MTRGLAARLLACCVAGCAAGQPISAPPPPAPIAAGAAPCRIDAAAIVPWEKWRALFPLPRHPFVAEYAGCGRRLVFVAVEHTNDPNSATYRQIEKAFAHVKPEFVVLEGFTAALGENPLLLQSAALRRAGRPSDSETFHAVRLALAADAYFQGGEPEDAAIAAAVAKRGVGAADLAGFYVLRQIDQWRREGVIAGIADPQLDARIREFVGEVAPEQAGAVGSLALFSAWYARVNGLPFETGYRPEDAHPTYNGVERATNRISNAVADARDAAIVATISAALERHETLLVVYGGSHHAVQAPAFEAAFGKPTFVGLY